MGKVRISITLEEELVDAMDLEIFNKRGQNLMIFQEAPDGAKHIETTNHTRSNIIRKLLFKHYPILAKGFFYISRLSK